MAKNTVHEKISAKKLGEVLGVGERWVRELERQGFIVKVAYGEYDLAASVQGYIRFVRESEVKPPEVSDADAEVKRERARKLKLENDAAENMLAPISDAVAAVDAIYGHMRSSLAGLPARVSDDVQLRRRVETEIDAALTELADKLEQVGRALATGSDPLASNAQNDG